jgi:hypothetical protein
MYNLSMTATLGVAAVVGTIAVVILGGSKEQILALGKDQASVPTQCNTEKCPVSTNVDRIIRKKVAKATQATQENVRYVEGEMILDKKDKAVRALAVGESVYKPLHKKLVVRQTKKSPLLFTESPPQRLAENPSSVQAEKPQPRRLRRADDPFMNSFN